MLGGPLISKNNNKFIGLLSYGEPSGSYEKMVLFAIHVNEIKKKISKNDNGYN